MIVNVNDLLILECIYYFEKQQQVLQIINKKDLEPKIYISRRYSDTARVSSNTTLQFIH